MSSQKSKDEIIAELQKYNKELLSKLESATEWMQKNVKEEKKLIETNQEFSHTAIEKKYKKFFKNHEITAISADIFDDILSSEILYHHMSLDTTLDGTGSLIGYNKAVDITIEYTITKPFRSFANKKSKNFLKSSRPEEKLLYQVVYHGYTLSLGKLYGILEQEPLRNKGFFTEIFFEFLEEYSYIKNTLLGQAFHDLVTPIVSKDYFGSKRHQGSVRYDELQEVRTAVIGNFENKNCILYLLFTM